MLNNYVKSQFFSHILAKISFGVIALALFIFVLGMHKDIFYFGSLSKTLSEKMPPPIFLPMNQYSVIGGINTKKKIIALTFDDGPSEKYTPEVLAILKKYNAKATFFVMGGNVSLHPDLVKEAFADGNDIGNHSFSHPNFKGMNKASITKELTKTNNLIYNTIDKYPVLFRPPYGVTTKNLTETASGLGFKVITWRYMVNDYDIDKTTAEKIASLVIKNASPGAIITMHDGNGNRSKTVAALPVIIEALQKDGYEFVTVSKLLSIEAYRE